MKERVILCVDMDAFFASVEQQSNPRLRNKPVAVIGSGTRTVITTRSYEARKYGVKTGMNIYEARRLCPHLIFVIGNNEKYTYTCSRLKEIYLKYSPDVEIYSIDEAFIDLTTTEHLFGGAINISQEIKRQIKELFGINCTIGIGPNILIAKLASDISKPDGLRWVRKEEIPELLEDLPLQELWGIGSGIAERLKAIGIETCGQLGRASVSILRNKFGIIGEGLKQMGLGICHREIKTNEEEPKSIGHSMTLSRDVYKRKDIEMYLLQLTEMVCSRARAYGYKGKCLTLTIRLPDFNTFSRQKVMTEYTNHTHKVYDHALLILNEVRLTKAVRLLGVSISKLTRDNEMPSLFKEIDRERSLYKAIDEINCRQGEFNIIWGSYLKAVKGSRVISPAWRPSGVRNITVR